MFRRYHTRAMICMILVLSMILELAYVPPVQAAVDKKSLGIGLGIGAAAGAGVALAGPAIAGAVSTVAGGVAGAAVAAGTAAVGAVGSLLGGIATVVGGALSAVGGFIVGLISSPLFIPALVVVGLAVAGYLLYKKGYKDGKRSAEGGDDVINDAIYVSPTDYEMSSTIPEGDAPVSAGTTEVITIASDGSDEVVISDGAPTQSVAAAAVEEAEASGAVDTSNSKDLKDAEERYIRAYNNYTSIVTNSGGADSATIDAALQEYRKAYSEYQTLKSVSSGN